MDPDSLLAENARITANATCGIDRREYYCRIVDHAAFYTGLSRMKRQVYTYTQAARTYKAVDGSVIECNYCDDRDPKLRHPINYVVQGDSDRWWQSPTLAEGLKYHAVTIDIDLNQVYCTTYFSQPQNLEAGEIIVTLTMDREGASQSHYEMTSPIDPELIDFLSARFVRLKFQKLQTLSGDWMTLPNQMDQSVYNRYYYSIRNIKVGGKCICNSHANRCESKVINGVPRAVCECQHNTCGHNCEKCCPLFNQQPWRPGGMCEECNCHGKADACEYNQTVANLQLSLNRFRVREGGGVCINCREMTTGINCEDCLPGYYRPLNVGPDAKDPCVPCDCNLHGSTGSCVSNDALMPEKRPGDCICRPGFAGQRCDRCALGYYQPPTNPNECVPCPCDLSGSQGGDGYRCHPPCNCKPNVDQDSLCKKCLPGHFNLDIENRDGCQACFCMGLTTDCQGVSVSTARTLENEGKLGTVDTHDGWTLTVPGTLRTMPVEATVIGAQADNASAQILRVMRDDVDLGLGSSASTRQVSYYWSAPPVYLGKQLMAYRGRLEVILRFGSPTIRSDLTGSYATSPRYESELGYVWVEEPDLVLEGHGIRLAYSAEPSYRDVHRVLRVRLHESSFRVLVEATEGDLNRFPISHTQTQEAPQLAYRDPTQVTRPQRINFSTAGRQATIVDIMTVLSNLTRIYIKAKYTDDQSYAELRKVALHRAERAQAEYGVPRGVPTVEECRCPPGHTGTSCEECTSGYWRDPEEKLTGYSTAVDAFFVQVNPIYKRVCVPCNCNGKSDQCDPKTGHCLNCKYNTAGPHCDQCAPGYYLDPDRSGPDACQPCECPSLRNQNTNSCVAIPGNQELNGKPYACLDCENNTRGRFCETCAPFYYGNPLVGQPCRVCDCGFSAIGCDPVTGECKCGYYTSGPRCLECEPGSFGDPLIGEPCKPCGCHPKGSRSPTCDKETGRCSCKMFYEGQRCDRCVAGRGNVEEGCPPCVCDPLGSVPLAAATCDPVTGQCVCKPGVGGTLECDRCLDGYYNLGSNGCQECQCSNRALETTCHPQTGQCKCGENVTGLKCDRCLPGYYWNGSEPHCIPCSCGAGTLGSRDECDMYTGQCRCAPYVTGRKCDQCERGFFGASPTGCQRCPNCPYGLVCDQVTGKCICPKNTEGDMCDRCSPNSYDFNPVIGCKDCNCSAVGSLDTTGGGCDVVTGQCACKTGFYGRACDRCQVGYFGYPNCRPCMCDAAGSIRNSSHSDAALCDPETGACVCKANVEGDKCDRCRPGSFGLNADYPFGCYACFCFPTDSPAQCTQLTGYRSVPGPEHRLQLVSTDNQYLPGGPLVDLRLTVEASTGSSDMPDLTQGQSQFKWRFSKTLPTFLQIPGLSGPLTRSYGSILVELHTDCLPSGHCGITTSTEETRTPVEPTSVGSVRTVIEDPNRVHARMLALNGQLEFEYQPVSPPPRTSVGSGDLGAEYYPIWMKESDWVLTRISTQHLRVRPTRAALMLALTNVTSVSVRLFMPRAEPKVVSINYRIRNAVREIGTQRGMAITTLETCTCPPAHEGDHCELATNLNYFPPIVVLPQPGRGDNYYDDLVELGKPSQNGTIAAGGDASFDYVAEVKPCVCNGKAFKCDRVTGDCVDCRDNTAGRNCEVCAEGYTGDPTRGKDCVKCRCPTEATDYAITCHPSIPDDPTSPHICQCRPGYVGEVCDRCDTGYYGDPLLMVPCKPCGCNPSGSRSQRCNMKTGQCSCLPGITGRQCDECQPGHVVDGGRCIDCRGECTGELLQRTDEVEAKIDRLDLAELANQGLGGLQRRAEKLKTRFSRPIIEREVSLIDKAGQMAKEIARITLATRSQLPAAARQIDEDSCNSANNSILVQREVAKVNRKLDDWMRSLRALQPGVVDEEMSREWHEIARMVRQEIGQVNMAQDLEWANELRNAGKDLETRLQAVIDRIKLADFSSNIERLAHYQNEQRSHLDNQEAQLYKMGNVTHEGLAEIKKVQENLNNIQDLMSNAVGSSLDQVRENQARFSTDLNQLQQTRSDYETAKLPEANRLVQELEDQPSFDRIPNSPPPDAIQKAVQLERTGEAIKSAVDSPGVESVLEARETYRQIADTLQRARNLTDEAQSAMKDSLAAQGGSSVDAMLSAVEERRRAMQIKVDQLAERAQSESTSSRGSEGKLGNLQESLNLLSKVADTAITDASRTDELVSQLKPLVDATRPKLDKIAAETLRERQQLTDTEQQVLAVEKRYNEFEGTANLAVDRSNDTQNRLISGLEATERRFSDLEAKLALPRRLAAYARSLLDMAYAGLGRDPLPLRLDGSDCVYTFVPYHVTKSRVFDLEFWYTATLERVSGQKAQQIRTNAVLMVGRRAFPGKTVMFAVTVEADGTLRFSWSLPRAKDGANYVSLGPLNGTATNRVRITAVPGEVSMYLQEIPEGVSSLQGLTIQRATFVDKSSTAISDLTIDNLLELRVGGPASQDMGADEPPMEAWGDNGAEELWAKVQHMGNSLGCLFNLRLSGHMIGFPDLANASRSCAPKGKDLCKIQTNFRPLVRDGYAWQRESPLEDGLEPHPRPGIEAIQDPIMDRLALHDFSGGDSYVRITSLSEIPACDVPLVVHLQKVSPIDADGMVLTFYDYSKGYGVTLESKNDTLISTRWDSDLQRSDRAEKSSVRSFRLGRNETYWKLDKPLAEDCDPTEKDKMVIFLGGLPPGHFELRRTMSRLRLTTTGFRGRIGLRAAEPLLSAALYSELYVQQPMQNYGDSRFSDIWQPDEALQIRDTKPEQQYCLTLIPTPELSSFELNPAIFSAPWIPEISMTVRFRPVGNDDIDLLRVQLAGPLWLRVWLTGDLRVSIAVPYTPTKLITTEIFGTPVINDPANNLAALKAREASVFDQPLYTEAVLTLHFGDENSQRLTVLFDQRPVQTWPLSKPIPSTRALQVLVGPHSNPSSSEKYRHEVSISNLVVGKRRVDFQKDMAATARRRSGSYRFGGCGAQLRPRFVAKDTSPNAPFVYQGLRLPSPPSGRRVRSIFELCDEVLPATQQHCDSNENITKEWPSLIHSLLSPKPSRRVGIRSLTGRNGNIAKNCLGDHQTAAWFDRTESSFWEITNVREVLHNTGPVAFRLSMGFRIQTSPDSAEGNTTTPTSVSLLATFNFGFKLGSLYLLASVDRIHLVHEPGSDGGASVFWTSPPLNLEESAWHRLEIIPEGGSVGADGMVTATRTRMLLDYHEVWIDGEHKWGLPVVAFIGGLPNRKTIKLTAGAPEVPLVGLFGCVDEFNLAGQNFDVALSKRPKCPQCFVLDSNAAHVMPQMTNFLNAGQRRLIPMNFQPINNAKLRWRLSFEVLYNPGEVSEVSLFVLVFRSAADDSEARLWIHLKRRKLVASDETGRVTASVSFPVSEYEPTAWHFSEVDVTSDDMGAVMTVKRQGEYDFNVLETPFASLEAVYYAYDNVMTPEKLAHLNWNNPVPPFTGCLRNVYLSVEDSVGTPVAFPVGTPNIVLGVCPL
ncbi:hypothetical protein SprV_0802463000 [Sparganum proliferum]